jgi:putative methyltransferase
MPKVSKKFKPVLGSRQPGQQQQQQRGQQQYTPKPKPAKQPKRGLPPSSDQQQPFKKRAVAVSSSQTHNQWQCSSVIDQQSAEVVEKLLLAAETRRGGATIKSLTLAPHIVHKKPTFAVTCETLKHLPLLRQLVADAGLLEQHQVSFGLVRAKGISVQSGGSW